VKVLVACEYSGAVRQAFRDMGHEAWSCDLLPADDGSPYHIQGDVLPFLDLGWDLLIGFPPCTRLCNSGVRWLAERNLWSDMHDGAAFFRALWDAPIPRICLENPVMHRYARDAVGVTPTQFVQPWQFGHGYTKRTGLFLKGLPPLVPTDVVAGRANTIHAAPPGPMRWKIRSTTPVGLARAMAAQWGVEP